MELGEHDSLTLPSHQGHARRRLFACSRDDEVSKISLSFSCLSRLQLDEPEGSTDLVTLSRVTNIGVGIRIDIHIAQFGDEPVTEKRCPVSYLQRGG